MTGIRRNTFSSAVAVLGLIVAGLCIGACWQPAEAGNSRMAKRQVFWAQTPDSAGGTTTFLEDENDTTRTQEISTSDWDWDAMAGTVSPIAGVRVWFVADVTDCQSDSIYFNVEQSVDGGRTWSRNTTITAGFGSVANSLSGLQCERVFGGALLFDIDNATVLHNVTSVTSIRLRVAGDVSGTTPALAGLRCWITYPKRD